MRSAFAVLAILLVAAGCITPSGVNLGPNSAPGAPGFSTTAVFPGNYVTDKPLSYVTTPGEFGILAPEFTKLASKKDGAEIQLGFARPDVPAGAKVPVIVMASPYYYNGITPDAFVKDGTYERLVKNFVPHGFAVAFLPVRGTADAGGCMDLMGSLERSDLDQAITWLGEQAWSNGNVGMVGVSYDGSTPWEVAGTGNPHLKTIVPISGVNDVFTLMYGSGVAETRGLLVLNGLYYLYGFQQYNPTVGRSPQHTVDGVVCPESLKGLAFSVTSEFSGERDPIGWWAERNSRPLVEKNYHGSIFLVHGLQDWNVDPHEDFPWVPTLESGRVVKYHLSQTDHAWPDSTRNADEKKGARFDWAEILLHWFEHELKGDASVDVGPRVEVQDNSGAWRSETAWPPADGVATTFYLDGAKLAPQAGAAGAVLVGTNPTSAVSANGIVGAPSLAPCATCPRLTSDALSKETRFAGLVQVHVNVTPSAPGGSLSLWLYDSDGSKETRVAWGAADLRYPHGGDKMTPVVPGQKMAVDLVLEPADVVIPAGHKLVAVFHMDGYSDHPDFTPAPVQLETGGKSVIVLPEIVRDDPAAFFKVPGQS